MAAMPLEQEIKYPTSFAEWLQIVILPRLGLPEDVAAEPPTLEEFAEIIDRWNRELRERGLQEGEALMLLQQLRWRFGSLAPEVEERVRSAEAGRLLEWGKRVLSAELLEDVFRG